MIEISRVKELKSTLSKIQPVSARIQIYTVNSQQQYGTDDCGLFAIACAYELCLGNNPGTIQFHQNELRKHYQICLSNKQLTSFPQVTRNVTLSYKLHRFNRG